MVKLYVLEAVARAVKDELGVEMYLLSDCLTGSWEEEVIYQLLL